MKGAIQHFYSYFVLTVKQRSNSVSFWQDADPNHQNDSLFLCIALKRFASVWTRRVFVRVRLLLLPLLDNVLEWKLPRG